jgi:hypothetical protein
MKPADPDCPKRIAALRNNARLDLSFRSNEQKFRFWTKLLDLVCDGEGREKVPSCSASGDENLGVLLRHIAP